MNVSAAEKSAQATVAVKQESHGAMTIY